MRLGEKHRVVPARTEGDEIGKPFLKAFAIGHETVVNGALQPVTVGKPPVGKAGDSQVIKRSRAT